MAVKRSVDGLRRSAQQKHQEALEKVEKGIQSLIKDKRPINFNAVAEASGVSKAWLYKEADIKDRIEQLRAQSSGSKRQPPANQRASDASKDALLKTMRERIKRLEAENNDLRRQNEVAYSHVLKARDLEKEVQRLSAHIERLQRQPQPNGAAVDPPNLEAIQSALSELDVELNSTLARLINQTPTGIVEAAIESLQTARGKGQVRNPGGFLNKAITDAWRPNEGHQGKVDIEEFNQWWKWAYAAGLVKAATQENGIQYVLRADNEWMPFVEARKAYVNTRDSERPSK
ncbi:MAG: hypothetical protein KME47_07785 [Nodosilinea sp. WJT8-NPBG4]|nr:hypothetical protein [Nodosilinea sp. WJT8-NPBG4]